MKDLLMAVLKAATDAGALITAVDARDPAALGVESKADDSPVTVADMAAQHFLAGALPKLLPGVPIVSEESGEPEEAMLVTIMTAPRYWLVDPLDGTRDFIAGTGEYTVNVALIENGIPVLGVIVAPAFGLRFVAHKGEHAFEILDDGTRVRLHAKPTEKRPLVCLISRFHQGGEVDALQALEPRLIARPMGSSLKYGHLARGDADFTVRRTPTRLWDTAAAQAILETAGGAMVQLNGQPLAYRTGVLTNPPFMAHGAAEPGVYKRFFR